MTIVLRVTTKSDGIRNEPIWSGTNRDEARTQLTAAKKIHDYAYLILEQTNGDEHEPA